MQVVNLTQSEAASGIFGSISLASWIFLTLPQLLENHRNGHANGISLSFLLIWLAGDVTNLIGAVWASLVPTVVALGAFFCVSDTAIIAQCLYYRCRTRVVEQTETASLLRHESHDDEGGRKPAAHPSHARAVDRRRVAVKNTLAVLGVIVVGTVGWAAAYHTGAWKPTPVQHDGGGHSRGPVGAEILGYISAALYLGARVPQIAKNQRERSCEGLSLLFFLLSLTGNATYGAAILFHSVEREYFLTNLPWLIGSLGTMAEDVTIFAQFSAFGSEKQGDD